MRRVILIGTVAIIVLAFIILITTNMKKEKMAMAEIVVKSTAFENDGEIPEKYTCNGDDMIPPLEISGVPSGAKSLALILEDPDAPKGTWYHWIKWNMPPDTKKIDEGEEPMGVGGEGTSGNLSYEGPCPPSGKHRYIFNVYALDIILELDEGSTKKQLGKAMGGHIIGQGKLVGFYGEEKIKAE